LQAGRRSWVQAFYGEYKLLLKNNFLQRFHKNDYSAELRMGLNYIQMHAVTGSGST